jgi:hypothetical protein
MKLEHLTVLPQRKCQSRSSVTAKKEVPDAPYRKPAAVIRTELSCFRLAAPALKKIVKIVENSKIVIK